MSVSAAETTGDVLGKWLRKSIVLKMTDSDFWLFFFDIKILTLYSLMFVDTPTNAGIQFL